MWGLTPNKFLEWFSEFTLANDNMKEKEAQTHKTQLIQKPVTIMEIPILLIFFFFK